MKTNKKKYAFIVMFFLTVAAFAQTASIKGSVVDNNNIPLIGVNIRIRNTQKGTQTDINGNFNIKNISKGTQTLIISHIGYKTKIITISVPTSNDVNLVLYEGNEILKEIVIDTKRGNKFSRKKTAYVSKLPLKNLDNPQVYSTVTTQLLISQNITSFQEALKNITGITKLWGSTGRGTDGAGYYALRGFSVQPKLVNGVSGITNGFINPNNVERIEVIKGPSATLFGSTITSYGGLINIVTKKPYQGTGGNISVTGGSFDFKKLTVDINTNMEDNQDISLRFNAGFQKENTFQDVGFKKSLFMAPSLTYKINNKLTLNFGYELSTTEQTNPTFLFLNRSATLAFKNLSELNYNRTKSLTSNDVSIKNPTQNYRGEITYKITDNWSSQTIIAGGDAKSEGIYTYLWNPKKSTKALPFFTLFAQKTNSITNTFNMQQNFTGDFKLGNFRNRLVVGLDYLSSQIIDKSSLYGLINTVTPQGEVVRGNPVNKANIETILANKKNSNTDVNQNIIGIYASNILNISPKLFVMAGVRYDRFKYKGDKNNPKDDQKEYTKSTFSPKFGIVYQPILNELSVFTNYQNGFSYVNPELVPINPKNPASKRVLVSYDLEQANQLEFGIKTNVFNNKLETTISYYDITVKNKVIGYGISKNQNGEVRSKGIEIEVNTAPINGLNIRGGYSYNNAEITKAPTKPLSVGKRYAEAGPKIIYNFWGDYKIQNGMLKNLGFGAGFNGASNFNTMADYPKSGKFILPAYTIFNASIYYETKKIRIGIKANNLTNKEYYKGWSTITPEQPRAFLGTVLFKF